MSMERHRSVHNPLLGVLLPVSTVRSAASAPVSQRRPTGPPHKPVTYVQQLKNINKAATMNKQPGEGFGGGEGRGVALLCWHVFVGMM